MTCTAQSLRLPSGLNQVVEQRGLFNVEQSRLQPHRQPLLHGHFRALNEARDVCTEERDRCTVQVFMDRGEIPLDGLGFPGGPGQDVPPGVARAGVVRHALHGKVARNCDRSS